jgi:PAS domain S-box-containing protein
MTQVDEGRRVDNAAGRVNSSLLALSRCNRVLWQARDEQELLQSICRILVKAAGVRLAWIGYCEDDAEKTVRPVASAGNGLDYLDRVKISWGHSDAGSGPVGDAIRTAKFCWVDNIRTDPKFSHGQTEAMALGYVSCVALPLVADVGSQGLLDLRGALTLYADAAFDRGEIEHYADLASCLTCAVARLRSNLADDVVYGVSALRTREDRKRTEKALRERAQLLDLTHDTIFVRDMSDVITFWNRGAEELYGWKSEQAVGKVCHQLTETLFPARLEEINAELFRTGRWEGELIHTKRDGTQVTVASRWALQRDEQGNPIAILETNNDITERKRAEYLIWHVFESSPDSISIVGRDYRYQRVNPVFARFWGMPAEKIVGMHVSDLMGRENFERRVESLDRCFAGEGVSFADWFATPHGRKYRAISYSPLQPDLQRVEAALVIARDLTEHVLASEALREAQMQLAHANRVTTMGQFTASIAHEVSQPIAAAVTNADAALRWLGGRPPDLQEVRESLEAVIKDGNRASEVIARIRALSKKVPPRHDQLDINEAILEVIELTRSELLRNGVSLRTELAKGLPLIRGDRIQLQQIVLNLVMNAVEAMSDADKGSRDLLISTAEDMSNGVLVAVQDSGPGLSRENLGRLFDPFYTTKPGGMGMGLSICRSIIEAHGGKIWATGNVPQGAAFQFTLPVG